MSNLDPVLRADIAQAVGEIMAASMSELRGEMRGAVEQVAGVVARRLEGVDVSITILSENDHALSTEVQRLRSSVRQVIRGLVMASSNDPWLVTADDLPAPASEPEPEPEVDQGVAAEEAYQNAQPRVMRPKQ